MRILRAFAFPAVDDEDVDNDSEGEDEEEAVDTDDADADENEPLRRLPLPPLATCGAPKDGSAPMAVA